MRTAKEIFKSKYPYGHMVFMNKVVELINEARKEAIEECAKRVKVNIIGYDGHPSIDKESILSIIKELD